MARRRLNCKGELKDLKKVISIILLITLFSSLTIVSASEKVQKTVATSEAIAFFEDFMIFDSAKGEDELITRAEFAQVI